MPQRQAIIDRLAGTFSETVPFFEKYEPFLSNTYGPGKWTAREILVHLSDTETVLLDRLRRLAADEKPLLVGFNENHWAQKLLYKTRDLALAKAQFEAARRSVIELALLLGDSVDANIGTHSEYGTRTFAQVLNHVAEHNAHHLEQLHAIADGKQWTPAAK